MFTADNLRAVFARKGYSWNDGTLAINIIGIRSKNSESNSFDDRIVVAYKDTNAQWRIKDYPFTTDPGKPWLLKPMDPGGCAVMVPGQYVDAYMIGIHGRSKPVGPRQYEALEQVGKIAYVRDNTRDSKINTELYKDPKNIFRAILKTNIHRSSLYSIQRFVETYSAGCQVFQSPSDFSEFMAICRLCKPATNRFTYTLLEEADLSV